MKGLRLFSFLAGVNLLKTKISLVSRAAVCHEGSLKGKVFLLGEQNFIAL